MGDSMARMRVNAERYGKVYAVFGEAFRGDSLKWTTRITSWFILGMAVLVVVLAVLSKF
jgi:hypothetical protein